MDFTQIYHFLFETYMGIGVLVALGLVIDVNACAIWEVRTRKGYTKHEKQPDEWSLLDDEEEENSGEGEA